MFVVCLEARCRRCFFIIFLVSACSRINRFRSRISCACLTWSTLSRSARSCGVTGTFDVLWSLLSAATASRQSAHAGSCSRLMFPQKHTILLLVTFFIVVVMMMSEQPVANAIGASVSPCDAAGCTPSTDVGSRWITREQLDVSCRAKGLCATGDDD